MLTLIPARAASLVPAISSIDPQMAQSILDRLNYTLRDLSIEYGDVVIPGGDISHQLYYSSEHNSSTIMGYIWCENDIYYTSDNATGNYRYPEQSALSLIATELVVNAFCAIELERALAPDFD